MVNGIDILKYADTFKGTKYVYGGNSPSGFDCSGLVQYVYKNFGLNIPRTASEQYNQLKNIDSMNDLKVGDLVFFKGTDNRGSNYVSHVGIYAGGGKMINSPKTGDVVKYVDITTDYYTKHFAGGAHVNSILNSSNDENLSLGLNNSDNTPNSDGIINHIIRIISYLLISSLAILFIYKTFS